MASGPAARRCARPRLWVPLVGAAVLGVCSVALLSAAVASAAPSAAPSAAGASGAAGVPAAAFDNTGLESNMALNAFAPSDAAPFDDPLPDDPAPDDPLPDDPLPEDPPADDSEAPVTADDADSAWHNEDVLLVLEADDGDGSGVASTEYSVDGDEWVESVESGYAEILIEAPSDHSGDGAHTIAYRSTDESDNVEVVQTCTVNIDTRRPTTAVLGKVDVRKGKTATVRFRVADGAPSSGSATATVVVARRNGTVVLRQRLSAAVRTNATQVYRITRTPGRGTYVVRVLATDAAGNVQTATASRRLIVR